jgi:hypothetical protein
MGIGKMVKVHRCPATVTGDEIRTNATGGILREGAESRFVTGSQETGPTGSFPGSPFAGEGSGRRDDINHPPTFPLRKSWGFFFEASAG